MACQIELKVVVPEVKAGSDAGSKAKENLSYYEYRERGHLMLGHWAGPGSTNFRPSSLVVAKEGPWVKRATGYKRVWKDEGRKGSMDYDIYIPVCEDPDFKAVGVICHFQIDGHAEPPRDLPVGLIHKKYLQTTSLTAHVWSDAGTGAKWDVSLAAVPGFGTMWPTNCTLADPGPAQTLKEEYLPSASDLQSLQHTATTHNLKQCECSRDGVKWVIVGAGYAGCFAATGAAGGISASLGGGLASTLGAGAAGYGTTAFAAATPTAMVPGAVGGASAAGVGESLGAAAVGSAGVLAAIIAAPFALWMLDRALTGKSLAQDCGTGRHDPWEDADSDSGWVDASGWDDQDRWDLSH